MKTMACNGPFWTTSVDLRNRLPDELRFLGDHVGNCRRRSWRSLYDSAESARRFVARRTVTCLALIVSACGLVLLAF